MEAAMAGEPMTGMLVSSLRRIAVVVAGTEGVAARRAAVCVSMVLLACTAAAALAQTPDSVVMERGRTLTQQFYAGQTDTIASAMNTEMFAAIGGGPGLASFREQLRAQVGEETEVVAEEVATSGVHRLYQRTARFSGFGGTLSVVWTLDGDGRVAGFFVRPAQQPRGPAASNHLEYETRSAMRLPFDGEWTVVWGGRTIEQNYHAAYSDQRFAYDILVTEADRTHRGDGRSNEDYFCFGRRILAPAAGTVVEARDGIPDNVPGELHESVPPGNHVIIDHGAGEHTIIAHLRNGTVRVSAGERVAAGDPLGECGNSGRSSEPHLHFHMQTTPVFGRGEGLPVQFLDYIANGEPVARGEPVKGQRVRPRPAK
jgi:hypothetical protein